MPRVPKFVPKMINCCDCSDQTLARSFAKKRCARCARVAAQKQIREYVSRRKITDPNYADKRREVSRRYAAKRRKDPVNMKIQEERTKRWMAKNPTKKLYYYKRRKIKNKAAHLAPILTTLTHLGSRD